MFKNFVQISERSVLFYFSKEIDAREYGLRARLVADARFKSWSSGL
jgi:hypothetical protein